MRLDKKIVLVSTGLGRVQRGFETYIETLAQKLNYERLPFQVLVYCGGKIKQGLFPHRVVANIHRHSRIANLFPDSFRRLRLEQFSFFVGMLGRLMVDRPTAIYIGEYRVYCYLFHLRRILRLKFSLILYTGGQAIPGLFDNNRDFVHHITDFYWSECGHIAAHRQFLIPHFLDVTFEADDALLETVRRMAAGKTIVLSVGAIEKISKRTDKLIEALAAVDAPIFPVLLGEETEDYSEILSLLIMHFGKGGFVLSKSPRQQLGTWYQAADAFVLCSPKESFGLVLLEAMYHGLEVACTKFSEVEYVMGDHGFWLDNDSTSSWPEDLTHFIQQLPSNKVCNLINHRYVQNTFSWQTLRTQYLNMFETFMHP